ncbi:MAG TPA: Crp/Fnr family transcriptional regulator [Gammaproteobacteria bacterium]|nr:Crp/Fnr family transcriptional regulator [Gammaproteobacteria bacterium]
MAKELRQHYLFRNLNEAQLARILARSRERAFERGERLFSRGEPAATFFLLRRGSAKLYRVSREGQEKVMRFIRPPQSFAETVMFMDVPRYPVHGDGVQPGVLLAIDCAAFLDILRESFATCRAVMAQMTVRIQAHWDEIEELTLENSRFRVVHYLLGLAPDGGSGPVTVTLPARKLLIASQLAITPETLSRILRSLSEEGLIEVQAAQVTLRDVAALRRHPR